MANMNIYEPRPYEDPRDRRRTVPMQVLNLSFPRTGSMSLQAALNHLGYECFHSVTAFTPTPKECDLWVDAMERKYLKKEKLGKEDFDVLMPHCSAVSADVPAIVFAEELVDAYPEAKVILYERDVDKWFHSFSTGVIKDMWDPYYNFVAKLNPSFVGRLGKVHQTWARLWMGANNAQEHRAAAKKVYRQHYDMMRRIVPKERLLEYEIMDGWEPLCTFLNKPMPDIPFPRVNDADARKEMAATMVKKGLEAALRKIGLYVSPVLVAGVVWYLYTNRS